jgi:HAD superfamily hydrolase (TIGR01509 family)
MTIKAIVFDCDGTLVDSEILANEVMVEYLAELGHVMTVTEAVTLYTGVKMAVCVADLERRFGCAMPEGFTESFRERMSVAFDRRLKPVAGAEAILSSIALPFYIASSGPRKKIEHSLSVTGLIKYFEPAHIFSAYEIGYWKPDPAFYRSVVSNLRVLPHEAIVVEDSIPGIRAALGAGLKTIAIGKPDRLVGDLAGAVAAPDLIGVRQTLDVMCGRTINEDA